MNKRKHIDLTLNAGSTNSSISEDAEGNCSFYHQGSGSFKEGSKMMTTKTYGTDLLKESEQSAMPLPRVSKTNFSVDSEHISDLGEGDSVDSDNTAELVRRLKTSRANRSLRHHHLEDPPGSNHMHSRSSRNAPIFIDLPKPAAERMMETAFRSCKSDSWQSLQRLDSEDFSFSGALSANDAMTSHNVVEEKSVRTVGFKTSYARLGLDPAPSVARCRKKRQSSFQTAAVPQMLCDDDAEATNFVLPLQSDSSSEDDVEQEVENSTRTKDADHLARFETYEASTGLANANVDPSKKSTKKWHPAESPSCRAHTAAHVRQTRQIRTYIKPVLSIDREGQAEMTNGFATTSGKKELPLQRFQHKASEVVEDLSDDAFLTAIELKSQTRSFQSKLTKRPHVARRVTEDHSCRILEQSSIGSSHFHGDSISSRKNLANPKHGAIPRPWERDGRRPRVRNATTSHPFFSASVVTRHSERLNPVARLEKAGSSLFFQRSVSTVPDQTTVATQRNDLQGGSGAGVGGLKISQAYIVTSPHGDGNDYVQESGLSGSSREKSRTGGKRRKWNSGTKTAKPGRAKFKRSGGRRSSKSKKNSQGGQAVWRSTNSGRRGGADASKEDPMLQNVGGAEISF